MLFTYVVNVYSDMSLSKGHLGSRGGGGGGIYKLTERHTFHLFNDKRHNFKAYFVRMRRRNTVRFGK